MNKCRSFDPEIAFTTELSEYLSHVSLERVDMLALRQGKIIEIFENAINITSMHVENTGVIGREEKFPISMS